MINTLQNLLNKRARKFVVLTVVLGLALVTWLHRSYLPDHEIWTPAAATDFDRYHIKYVYPEVIDYLYQSVDHSKTDWSRLAYVFYATESLHVCNAMMIIHQLVGSNSKAKFLILVNSELLDPENDPVEYKKLSAFAEAYDSVVLKPTGVTTKESGSYWENSFTKLEVFKQFDFDRLIYLDTDAILPHGNLDELFFIPPAKMATVTGYWLTQEKYERDPERYVKSERVYNVEERQANASRVVSFMDERKKKLLSSNEKSRQDFFNSVYNELPTYETIENFVFSSILMVITPSEDIAQRIDHAFENRESNEFDMDMLNFHVFRPADIIKDQISRTVDNDIPDMLLLPHQIYGCLTLQLNTEVDHRSFLADPQDQPYIGSPTSKVPYYVSQPSTHWFPNVKYLHFSDGIIPKPWKVKDPKNPYMKQRARCESDSSFTTEEEGVYKPQKVTSDCDAGVFWEKYHAKFASLRKQVCDLPLIGS